MERRDGMEIWRQAGAVLLELNLISVTFRLLLAAVVGSVIGLDRGKRKRGAGVKTYSLVCLGSALVMMTGEFIHLNYGGSGDVARLGAQVISGIGFLGVGTIIITGNNQVQGLTTAAGLWACACMGLAIGIGFYAAAFVAFAIVTFLFYNVGRIENFMTRNAKVVNLFIEFDSASSIHEFIDRMKEHHLMVSGIEMIKPRISKDGLAVLVSVTLSKDCSHARFLDILKEDKAIVFFEEL